MPVISLTDLTIRSLPEGLYLDKKTPSFGIRVGKNRRSWIVIHADRAKAKFGLYPSLSLSDARAEAKRLLSSTPEPKQSAITFSTAKDLFLADNYKDASERTKYEAARHLKKRFKSLLNRPLADITDADIKRQLDKMADTPSEQLHAYRTVRCFLKWATRPPRRFIRHSPMEGYEPPAKDRKRTRILTDDELRAVWKAASAPPHSVVRLMILWGTRNTETAVMERSWRKDGVLTIPGINTKNGRDHAIPLLPLALAELEAMPAGTHYFRSRWGSGHLSDGAWNKIKREIQEASGTSGWQLRDLRRTFRSNMARLKVPREICEVLINHAPKVLDEIYDRYDRLPEKAEALARYEAHIQTLIATG